MKLSSLKSRAYTPYSGTPSYSLVKSETGRYYPGVRIENISFPLSIQAGQCALFNCISEGEQPAVIFTADPENKIYSFWENEYDLEIETIDEESDADLSDILIDRSVEISKLLTDLQERSVTIHSNFPVSALIETESGYISGVNIENSSWDMGLCAERVALAKAIAYGYRDFKSLHVYAKWGEFSSPCGACRQVIIEHMPRTPVYIHHSDQTVSQLYSSDLLPYSFKSDALKQKDK